MIVKNAFIMVSRPEFVCHSTDMEGWDDYMIKAHGHIQYALYTLPELQANVRVELTLREI